MKTLALVDVIEVTGTDNPRRYWSDLKRKIKAEGSKLYEEIVQLKITAPDGKMRLTKLIAGIKPGDCFMNQIPVGALRMRAV